MISIVIPVFNQLHYTKSCLECLGKTLPSDAKIVIVNNGSTDDTKAFLEKYEGVILLQNEANLGCAPAWNQGVKALNADWTVVLNNDVLLPPGWLEALVQFAEGNKLDIVSPAIREGDMNYEFESYARDFVQRMAGAVRFGVATGICFMVRREVFEKIGYFDENFRVGQFEDSDFFLRAQRAGFKLGTTGKSFIHHFGSVTQNSLRKEKKIRPYENENRAYFRQKWKLGAAQRLWMRWRNKTFQNWSRFREQWNYGHSLNEKWIRGKLRYY